MASEKAMAPHSSTRAWKILWTEEPGRLQSMESLRVRHDLVTSLSLFTSCIGECRGPAPVDPGNSKRGRHRRGSGQLLN